MIIYQLFRPIVLLQQRDQLDDIGIVIIKLVAGTVEADDQRPIRVFRWNDGRRCAAFQCGRRCLGLGILENMLSRAGQAFDGIKSCMIQMRRRGVYDGTRYGEGSRFLTVMIVGLNGGHGYNLSGRVEDGSNFRKRLVLISVFPRLTVNMEATLLSVHAKLIEWVLDFMQTTSN